MENNDSKLNDGEDPYSLPAKKGLRSYWLHFNTWSIDGLPGFRQVSDRANKDLVRKVMSDVGLDYEKTIVARRSSPERWFLIFVGVILGFLLPNLVNGNLVSGAKQRMCV